MITTIRRHPFRLLPPVLAGCLAVLAACGAGSAGPGTAGPTTGSGSGQSLAGAPFSGAVGRTAAIAHSLEVQNPAQGQVTVDFSGSTKITQLRTSSLSAVRPGDCVAVTGSPSGGAVAAATVAVSSPVGGGCQRAGFTGGVAGRRSTHHAPRGTGSPRPAFAAVTGSVTAVHGGTITVSGVLRTGGPTTPGGTPGPSSRVPVTVSGSTRYSAITTVTSAAFRVGQCVLAVGPTDSIGTVTARSIVIRAAGPTGCTFGYGFGQGGQGGADNA